jgi:hypothetical protein
MSEQTNMTYQDAFGLLTNRIYAPTFFQKLASDFGVSPTTEEEARELLALSGKLQQLYEVEQQKQASDRVSLVSAASKGLDNILTGVGAASAADLANDEEVKAAAAALSEVPELRDAALLYQDALRQLLAN